MKKVMCKIRKEIFRYISFCRSCRYFKNGTYVITMPDTGMAKYAATLLLLLVLAVVSVFTSRTQLPDGTQVAMDIVYTNWPMWVAALMLLFAISTRGVQGRLTPMSHRRRAAYYMLRPVIMAAIVCICLVAVFWLAALLVATIQYLAGNLQSVDVELTEYAVYELCPSAYLWFFSSAIFFFFIVLFIAALGGQKVRPKGSANCFFAALVEYKRHMVAFAGLAFYYVLSFIACNLTPFKPARGFEFFSNPIIALEYLPEWQGWLFAGIMAAAAITSCALAIVFTCRECRSKNF